MAFEIRNTDNERWVLTSFGAYGPTDENQTYAHAVYFFTKVEARRVLKSKRKHPKLSYASMRNGNQSPTMDRLQTAKAYIKTRSIQFGCQMWEGPNARALRNWAFSK